MDMYNMDMGFSHRTELVWDRPEPTVTWPLRNTPPVAPRPAASHPSHGVPPRPTPADPESPLRGLVIPRIAHCRYGDHRLPWDGWGWLGTAGDGWGWLGMAGDPGDQA